MPIVFSDRPPNRLPNHSVQILVVRTGESWILRRLGPAVWTPTHWDEGRSRLCRGEEDCRRHHLRTTWKGWLPVVAHGRNAYGAKEGWHRWVLCATEGIADLVAAWLTGETYLCQRPGLTANAPLTLAKHKSQSKDELPESFDVKPLVLRALSEPQGTPIRVYKGAVG